MHARIERWNGHLLFKAGKVTFIKSVVQSLPTYMRSTFCVPKNICNDINASVRDFWWKSDKNSKGLVRNLQA